MKKAILTLAFLLALGCATTGFYQYVRVGASMQHEIDSTVQCYDIDIAGKIPQDVLKGTRIRWESGSIMMIWDIPNKIGDEATIYLNPHETKRVNRELTKHFIGHLILMRTLGITSYEGRTQWMQRHSLCMTDLTDCRNEERWLADEDPARSCYE